jgi:BirA family biotin operon repressor/biotin-[acetyl-CoA-carboxylase] ligase
MSAKINVDKLQEGLHTKQFGKWIVFLREVGSTNDYAKELANYGAPEGTVVIAETQKAGRGRLGREWVSPKGGLYFSIVLRPKLIASEAVGLVFVAGLAVAKVLNEVYGLKAETKWPNDVLVNGKKICGILSEMTTTREKVNYAIVGIGINANIDVEKRFQGQLKTVVTSIENELGRTVKLEELFVVLLEKLESLYELFLKEGFNPILEGWKSYATFLGCQVEAVGLGGKWVGLALDVEDDGSLIIRLENGTVKHLFAGDVSLRSE